MISSVSHQTDVRLQRMGANEAPKEFSLSKKKIEVTIKAVNSFCALSFYIHAEELPNLMEWLYKIVLILLSLR